MNTTTFAYRDDVEGARLRYADLRRTFGREGFRLSRAVRVFASRTGRAWAGTAGIAGASVMALTAALGATNPPLVDVSPTLCLLLSWLAVSVAYVAGSLVGARRVRRATAPPETGDVHADLARLETARPVAEARELSTRLERASVALPMIALALLAPLTIHGLFCLLTGMGASFDGWIRMSLLIVGHAHLALAALYWCFARDASRLGSEALARCRSRSEWNAFGITVAVSAMPGVILLLIPPVLTAVTALVFHPLLFRTMTRTIIAERAALS